jgi:hypothetical protein
MHRVLAEQNGARLVEEAHTGRVRSPAAIAEGRRARRGGDPGVS